MNLLCDIWKTFGFTTGAVRFPFSVFLIIVCNIFELIWLRHHIESVYPGGTSLYPQDTIQSAVNLFWDNLLYVFYICIFGQKSPPPKMIPICLTVFLASDEPTTHCTKVCVPRPASKMLGRKCFPYGMGGVLDVPFFVLDWQRQAAIL